MPATRHGPAGPLGRVRMRGDGVGEVVVDRRPRSRWRFVSRVSGPDGPYTRVREWLVFGRIDSTLAWVDARIRAQYPPQQALGWRRGSVTPGIVREWYRDSARHDRWGDPLWFWTVR